MTHPITNGTMREPLIAPQMHSTRPGAGAHLSIRSLGTSGAKPPLPIIYITTPEPNMATHQKPAKPVKNKNLPKDEDYSTTYKPPVAEPTSASASSGVAPIGLEAFLIEDDIPIPSPRGSGANLLYSLLGKLQPKQSVVLDVNHYASMSKARIKATKEGLGRYISRSDSKTKTFRVWRIA